MNWSCPRPVRQCFLTRMNCWASSWLFTQMRDSTETESSTSVLRSGQPIPTNHQRSGNLTFIRVFFIMVNIQVKCETKVYHPNIDLDGNVCLNILREDWKPVLTINSIVYGLQYLFLVSILSGRVDKNQDDSCFFLFQEPNPEDPLNKEAALELQNNRRLFEQNVGKSMRGGSINGVYFERCYKWSATQKSNLNWKKWIPSLLLKHWIYLLWLSSCTFVHAIWPFSFQT